MTNPTYKDRGVLLIMIVLIIVVMFLSEIGSFLVATIMVVLAIIFTHTVFRV
jgi:hypothetical protein